MAQTDKSPLPPLTPHPCLGPSVSSRSGVDAALLMAGAVFMETALVDFPCCNGGRSPLDTL